MSDEHLYSLAGQSLIASHHHSIDDIRRIGEEESARIDYASKQVGDFVVNRSLYEICDTNYKELVAYYEKVSNEYRATHEMEGSTGTNILIELNRLLMNYLSSFKSMIDERR